MSALSGSCLLCVVQQTVTRFIERVAQQNNIHYVNLYHHFHGASCNSLYYHFGNNHWNDEGQAMAVDLVSEAIQGHLSASGALLGRWLPADDCGRQIDTEDIEWELERQQFGKCTVTLMTMRGSPVPTGTVRLAFESESDADRAVRHGVGLGHRLVRRWCGRTAPS